MTRRAVWYDRCAALAREQAANGITLGRGLLIAPFLSQLSDGLREGSPRPAAWLLFSLIAGGDLIDGWVARRLGTASDLGRRLDHGIDIVFVFSSLSLYASFGSVPFWVPVCAGVAFSAYAADQWQGGPRPGRYPGWADRVGHAGGVLNVVLIGVLLALQNGAVSSIATALADVLVCAVPVYSGIPIVLRLAAWRRRDATVRVA